jgi:hypothetical protein
MSLITVRPGETITVIGVAAGPAGPVDPGFSPPWAQVPPGQEGGRPPGMWGPGDPRPTNPIAGFDPIHGTWPPVDPPTEPPPIQPPAADSGHWVWAWSPQQGRWVWVKVPGEGEAGPKT